MRQQRPIGDGASKALQERANENTASNEEGRESASGDDGGGQANGRDVDDASDGCAHAVMAIESATVNATMMASASGDARGAHDGVRDDEAATESDETYAWTGDVSATMSARDVCAEMANESARVMNENDDDEQNEGDNEWVNEMENERVHEMVNACECAREENAEKKSDGANDTERRS